ncbi:cytochrome P450 oxidoreductase [Xylaria cubensis]|nr:cytochrome P450 oxidoreductase [Xylaria cubensis]
MWHQYGDQIYTLRLPGLRLYIVNNNQLISLIERQTKTISFAPIESQATAMVLGTSMSTNKIMARDPGSRKNHFAAFRRTIRPVLSRGPILDGMLRRSFDTMASSIGIHLSLRLGQKVKLVEWTGHEIAQAGTNAEYGEVNPFKDPQVEQSWHNFIAGLPILVSGFIPWVLARKSLQAREHLSLRFLSYFQNGWHVSQGSGAVLARLRYNTATGMSLADTARGEVGACMALLNNTIPGAFWLIYHIYSDVTVLQDIRHELITNAVRLENSDEDDGTRMIDAESVLSACPVLQSTMQEVFRFRGIGTGMVRSVLEDQILDSQFYLKKGSLIFAPNSVQHFAPSFWGGDCEEFDYRRFLPKAAGGRAANAKFLRIFGGGGAYCPGRHFASSLLLIFAALVSLQLEIQPTQGQKWEDITTEKAFGLGIATGFLVPDHDLEVEISALSNKKWLVNF